MDIGQSLGPILTGVMLGIFAGKMELQNRFRRVGGLMIVAVCSTAYSCVGFH